MTSRLLIPPHGHSLRGPRRTAFTLTNAESEASGATSDNIARKLPDVARPHDRTAARSPQLDRTLQELMLRTLLPCELCPPAAVRHICHCPFRLAHIPTPTDRFHVAHRKLLPRWERFPAYGNRVCTPVTVPLRTV